MAEPVGNGPTVWAPQAGSQTLAMSCPYFELLYEGTRGPGKTDWLLMDYAQHAGQGYGRSWRGIIFRRTYKQLADIVTRSKKWFYQIFPGVKFNEAEYTWKWPTGEELLFRYMNKPDDYWNYHGHEYPFIGWEELTNWATLECYESMKSCCRSSDPRVPKKYRSNCNPFGRGHAAVKRYFIDPAPAGVPIEDKFGRKRVRLFGSIYENKILLKANPEYLWNLESITDENKRRAWLFGDWDITSGGALDDLWDRGVHVLQPFQIPSSWRVDRSFDWGSAKPFSVGWWAESDGTQATLADGTKRSWPRGTIFRIAEWYGGQEDQDNVGIRMNSVDIGKGIFEKEQKLKAFLKISHIAPGPADASIYDKEDEDSIALKIDRGYSAALGTGFQGVFVPANKAPGTRKQGLELIRTRLEASLAKPMEHPGLFVFDTCRHWLRTVPVIGRDDDDPDDVDSEAEDHAYDETRYRILHVHRTAALHPFRL